MIFYWINKINYLEYLMKNWGILNMPSELLDFVGCTIPDAKKQNDVYLGLNG